MKKVKKQNRHTISLSDQAEARLMALHKVSGAKISTIIERLLLKAPTDSQ